MLRIPLCLFQIFVDWVGIMLLDDLYNYRTIGLVLLFHNFIRCAAALQFALVIFNFLTSVWWSNAAGRAFCGDKMKRLANTGFFYSFHCFSPFLKINE